MPTISSGQTATVRCTLASDITVSPGSTCKVSVQSLDAPSFMPATINNVQTFACAAGDVVNITAVGADATYTESTLIASAQLSADGFAAPAVYSAHHVNYYTHSEIGPDGSTPVAVSAPSNMVHDLLINADTGLLDPVTSKSAAAFQIYVGQPLVAIPGAVSAPYWTDAGMITHNVGAGTVLNEYEGQIDYIQRAGRKVLRLRSPEGYGDAAGNGARRAQIRMPPLGNRGTYHWRITFEIPEDDDPCFDAATKYAFPVLFWQIIGSAAGSQPIWSLITETTSDPNTFRLLSRFRWSGDDDTTTPVYRRQNGASTGTAEPNDDQYLCDVPVYRNTVHTVDYVIKLDERGDSTTVYGYARAWLDGVKIVDYAGPTYYTAGTAGATEGTLSSTHATLYRFGYSRTAQLAGGNPTGVEELDLDNPTTPAPYTRVMLFHEWRMSKIA